MKKPPPPKVTYDDTSKLSFTDYCIEVGRLTEKAETKSP